MIVGRPGSSASGRLRADRERARADHTEHADALDPAERRIEVVVVEQREGPGTNPTDIVSVWCGASAPADAVMTTPPSGLVWEVIEAQASDAAWPP
jgi:hypothetical protein